MLIYTQQPACMNVYVLHYANHCSRHYTQQTVEANPEKDLSVGFFTVKEVPVLRCYFFPKLAFFHRSRLCISNITQREHVQFESISVLKRICAAEQKVVQGLTKA